MTEIALEPILINEQKFRGDHSASETYMAVGEVMTQWTRVEESLSALYTVFEKKPGCQEVYKEHGRSGATFRSRLCLIIEAGERFFHHFPNQDNEGCLPRISHCAKELAWYRNMIAHSQVVSVQRISYDEHWRYQGESTCYHLQRPWFSASNQENVFYKLSSEELKAISRNMAIFDQYIYDLINTLIAGLPSAPLPAA